MGTTHSGHSRHAPLSTCDDLEDHRPTAPEILLSHRPVLSVPPIAHGFINGPRWPRRSTLSQPLTASCTEPSCRLVNHALAGARNYIIQTRAIVHRDHGGSRPDHTASQP